MVSFVNQFAVYTGNFGPTVSPFASPSATASVELTNEVIWIVETQL